MDIAKGWVYLYSILRSNFHIPMRPLPLMIVASALSEDDNCCGIHACTYSIVLLHSAGPHRGIPNDLAASNNHAYSINPLLLPSAEDAAISYEAHRGRLTHFQDYCSVPLQHDAHLLQQRKALMEASLPSPEDLFSYTVNNHVLPFTQALCFMID